MNDIDDRWDIKIPRIKIDIYFNPSLSSSFPISLWNSPRSACRFSRYGKEPILVIKNREFGQLLNVTYYLKNKIILPKYVYFYKELRFRPSNITGTEKEPPVSTKLAHPKNPCILKWSKLSAPISHFIFSDTSNMTMRWRWSDATTVPIPH